MRFKYIAFDGTNQLKKGIVEAANLKEATSLLIGKGWYVRKISPQGKLVHGGASLSFGRVPLTTKALFVKHLATMIKSGINLYEALEVVAEQTGSRKFKQLITDVLSMIKKGQSFGNTLEKYPKEFDPLFVNIIKVGEESGTLEENLDYLANEMEERIELRRNIQAAAFYPAIVLFATFGLGLVLAYFVLPKITKLFDSLNFKLPFTTRLLLGVAELMDKHGLWVIAITVGSLILLRLVLKLKAVKPLWHRVMVRLPLVGNIIINYNLVIVNRTLGILLRGGLTIDRALTITIGTTKNYEFKRHLSNALPQIQRGKRLADILEAQKQSRRHPIFPLLATKMIGVGERSGRLEESFNYLAEYFEKEVSNATRNLTTILEPVLLLTVGLIVGFVAVSVISPIYQITSQFRG